MPYRSTPAPLQSHQGLAPPSTEPLDPQGRPPFRQTLPPPCPHHGPGATLPSPPNPWPVRCLPLCPFRISSSANGKPHPMHPDFKNPPINEVVIATYFSSPLSGLRTEHIGLFWAQIKNEFPSALQRPPVPLEELTAGSEVFPTPRYWFVSADDASLLQVQKSAFMFNWRRRLPSISYYQASVRQLLQPIRQFRPRGPAVRRADHRPLRTDLHQCHSRMRVLERSVGHP